MRPLRPGSADRLRALQRPGAGEDRQPGQQRPLVVVPVSGLLVCASRFVAAGSGVLEIPLRVGERLVVVEAKLR